MLADSTVKVVDGLVELYIRCDKCKFERILGRSTGAIMKVEKEIRMMEKKYEHRSHEGKTTASLHRAISHKKRRLQNMRLHAGLSED